MSSETKKKKKTTTTKHHVRHSPRNQKIKGEKKKKATLQESIKKKNELKE